MSQIERLIKVAESNNEFNSNYNPPFQEEFYEFKYMKNHAIYEINQDLQQIIDVLKRGSSLCKTYMNEYHDEALVDCFDKLSQNIQEQKELFNSLFLIKKEKISCVQ